MYSWGLYGEFYYGDGVDYDATAAVGEDETGVKKTTGEDES